MMRGAVMIGLTGVSLIVLAGACTPATPGGREAKSLPQVRVAMVDAVQHAGTVSGVGTVALRRETSLGFTSAGRIARVTVNEGDGVRRGQVLAALDTTTVAADLMRARAERERAAAEYRRSEGLMAQGWITRPRLESAKSALSAADASVQAASFQTNNARIVAPGSGVVLARLAEPGQVVSAGSPILVVGEASSGYVLRVPLSDRDVARLTKGAPAQVRLAALGSQPIAGRVIEIAGRGNPGTGTFAVEVALPVDTRLRSGQIGEVDITASTQIVSAITVPATAIFSARAGQGFVYVVDRASRRTQLRRVMIAEATDGGIQVTGGLSRGELIATSRVDQLKDGQLVAPIGQAQ